jgi:hypothetical protein
MANETDRHLHLAMKRSARRYAKWNDEIEWHWIGKEHI